MCLEIDGIVIVAARMRADGWREVSHWPRFFDGDQSGAWSRSGQGETSCCR
jgi:hypothetical protein